MRRALSSQRMGNAYAASICLLVEKEKKQEKLPIQVGTVVSRRLGAEVSCICLLLVLSISP